MPFFESASEYRITGDNFQDIRGDINEHHRNNSVRVDGQGNAVTYNHGSHQNGSGSNITNNCSGSMTIIGQGDNVRVQLSSFDFQGNNGFFQMPPYPQVHVSIPQNDPRHASFPYPPQGSPYFDPHMGQPQQFIPERTMYQPNISYVNQFPTAHVHTPSTANYTAGPINMAGTQNPPSWGEPPGTTRSTVPTENPVDFSSFYNPAAPSSPSPPMIPIPSPAQASAPLHWIPSPVPVPEPLPARAPPPAQAPAQTSVQMPVPSQSPGPDMTPTPPVAQRSIQFPHSPRERAITPPISHSSLHYARTEVHPSPSDLSQDAAHWNSITPYSHRAVYQTHADETLHTALRQDGTSAPRSVATSNPTVERRSERVSSPSPSHRSSSALRPSESEPPQSTQKLQLDTFSPPPPNQIASTSAASASTSVAVRSPTPQEDQVSAHPSEKAIRGIHEVELSLESMPPPAYSLEPEAPFQTGEISQEATPAINSPSNTGLDNQENRYSPSRTEVVRQEEDYSMPDIILPKKKKKKTWSVIELFMRRSRKNTKPGYEL